MHPIVKGKTRIYKITGKYIHDCIEKNIFASNKKF